MTGFDADWLTLREPADRRARDPALLRAVAARFAGHRTMTVTDLACGTGSTLRAITRVLPARQAWRLVDDDPRLLERAARAGLDATPPAPVAVQALRADLAVDLEAVIAHDADLVTTSAFLDLVSDAWIAVVAIDPGVDLVRRLSLKRLLPLLGGQPVDTLTLLRVRVD